MNYKFILLVGLFVVQFLSLKSQTKFQMGIQLIPGINFNHIKGTGNYPFSTKNLMVCDHLINLSYHLNEKFEIESGLGFYMTKAFLKVDVGKIGMHQNLNPSSGNDELFPMVPLICRYYFLDIKNNIKLFGIAGVNNLFTLGGTQSISSSKIDSTTVVFNNTFYELNSGYFPTLLAGVGFEYILKAQDRFGIKIFYQQGFKELTYFDVYYSIESYDFDEQIRVVNKGSQLNLGIYYYFRPFGEKKGNRTPTNTITN